MGIPLAVRKSLMKSLDCILSGVLHRMAIYLSDHFVIYVTGDTDNGDRIHTMGDQMRNTGMPAGIRRERTDTIYLLQGLIVQGSEIRITAGTARFLWRFPNESLICISQIPSAIPNQLRNRDHIQLFQ